MSLALLFPLGLAALAAWALPLLLHLVRREKQVPTDFAALRWLAVRAKPRQRLRFDEKWLLAVRLALIATFALLLARPAIIGADSAAAWVVVHPAAADAAGMRDAAENVERRWLAPGFPPIDPAAPRPAPTGDTASLLRQLDAELPSGATLTVHVPATLDGLDAARLRLSREVDWRVAADAPATASEAPIGAAAPPRLAIRHDDAHPDAVRWLRAAAIAWQRADRATADHVGPGPSATAAAAPVDVATIDATLPADGEVLAWLATGPLPAPVRAWIERGGIALLAQDADWPLPDAGAPLADPDGDTIAEAARLGDGRIVRLRRPLRAADWPLLLEPTFPRVLRGVVTAPPPAPARADATAVAPLAGGPGYAPPAREFPGIPVAIVLALFALERLLATGRRKAAT